MKVFLSWSGDRSRVAAQALSVWIRDVLQGVETWISVDIGAGQRWSREIDEQLSRTDFGILCLTRENLQAPWLLFEAGALAKRVEENARLVPYLVDDMPQSEIEQPLGLFQGKKADKSGTYELIQAINTRLENSVDSERVNRTFERFWPSLESKLANIPASVAKLEQRSNEDILGELLESVRGISRRLDRAPVSFLNVPKPYLDTVWGQIVRDLRMTQPAAAAVYEEAECVRFTEDELVLEFPEDLAIYAKLAGDKKRLDSLLEVIERLRGVRPSLRFGTGASSSQ